MLRTTCDNLVLHIVGIRVLVTIACGNNIVGNGNNRIDNRSDGDAVDRDNAGFSHLPIALFLLNRKLRV